MNLEIRFLGVFLLIRPKAAAPPDQQVARVLIPNTIDAPSHEDGDRGVKHYPFLVRDDTATACQKPSNPQPLLELHHTEVMFRFDPDQAPGTPQPSQMNWAPYLAHPLIAMRSIHPELRVRRNLSPFDRGPDPRLGARITLDRGNFGSCPHDGSAAEYRLNGRMTPNSPQINPAAQLTWFVTNVPAVFIDFRRTETADWDTLQIKSGSGTVRLTVGHLCTDHPSKWHECGTSECVGGQAVDDDFKWLYRLLELRTGSWPTDRRNYFSVPIGLCAPDPNVGRRGATTSTCFGGDCGDDCD